MEKERSSSRLARIRASVKVQSVGRALFVIPVTLRVWASTGYSWWELIVWLMVASLLAGIYEALREEADHPAP